MTSILAELQQIRTDTAYDNVAYWALNAEHCTFVTERIPMAYTKANLKRLRAIIREGKVIVARIERKQTSKAERRRILAKPENWHLRICGFK